jgi:hypothetical protein
MNWRRELMLICLTIIAARGIAKWFGEDILTALVGVGIAVIIGFEIRDRVKSKAVGERRASQ